MTKLPIYEGLAAFEKTVYTALFGCKRGLVEL